MLNQTLSGYTILRLLGKGGMADVYYAENKLKRPAAIKILHASLSSQHEVKLRFESEAQIMVSLDHPNIRKVYDVAEIDDRPAIIMEYLEGHTLSEALTNKLLDPSILPGLFNQVVSGLQYAPQKGIIHRDIKPSNLFLSKEGQLKILDFGIAKVEEASSHTLTGQTLGTVLYMSPEQIQDPKRVGYKTDFYSLGVTFYHLLTGKPPYNTTTDSIFNIQTKIVREDLDLNSLSLDWRYRLTNYLAKLPEDRRSNFDEPFTTLMESTANKKTAVLSYIPTNTKGSTIKKRIVYLILIMVIIGASAVGGKKLYTLLDEKRWERVIKYLHKNYDEQGEFWDDMARVSKNGKCGFVNKYGKEVTAIIYDSAEDFSENYAAVKLADKWGYIDKNGNQVIPFEYDEANKFSEGLAPVKSGQLWGYIDAQGESYIPFKFEYAFPFSEGRAIVTRLTEPENYGDFKGISFMYDYGYIDKSGTIIIPMQYKWAGRFQKGIALVRTNNDMHYSINRFGDCVKDCP